jgi:hypothetical protein
VTKTGSLVRSPLLKGIIIILSIFKKENQGLIP